MHRSGWHNVDQPIIRTFYIIGVGLLAVSTIPTFSIKHASIKRSQMPFAIITAVIAVVGIMTYTWSVFIVLNLGYLGTLPFSYVAHKNKLKMGTGRCAFGIGNQRGKD